MAQPNSYIFPIITIDPTEGARGVVTHQEWNAILNSLLAQGNYTSLALQDVFNNMYTAEELSKTSIGSDGSRLIGVDSIPGVTGDNMNAVIRNLKEQLDTVVLGAIPDASITSAKLAPDLNFTGTSVKFNNSVLLTEGRIDTGLNNNSTTQVASASTVYSLQNNKQNNISIGTAAPTVSTPGNIYLQYIA